ncbi:S8 family serine peptidase, partial [Patescibacteria group bacterium]|nr:S8 family serine peptidase [Patescibacteria group bacterium]
MANTLHRTLGIAVLAVFVLTSVPAPAYAQVAENLSRGQVLERGKQMPKRGKMVREMEMERPEMLNVERGNMPSKFKQKSDMAVVDSNETGGDYVEGEVLVKFKNSNINLKSFRGKIGAKAFANRKNLKMRDEIKSANIAVMTPDDGETVQQLVDRLKNDPSVEHVQPNYIYYPYAISANDTYKDLLWGLDNTGQSVNGTSGTSGADIEAQKAWNISEGSSSVVVAVIDSGVNYNHPDLAANMWDGSSCKDDSGNVLGGCNHGYDYEDDDITPLPTSSSHGTHIAGTIAAVKNNSRGVIGVVPNTKVMAIKTALTSGKLVKSINFAQQNGADIINASWGGSSSDAALNSAIDSFSGLFIAAAGNATINHSVTADYPCDHTAANIICVAATDQDDDIADFSDYGATSVDVGAPGKNIYSTIASDKVLDETFESVTPPAVPAGWTATGDWGTYNLGGSVGNVLYGDFTPPPYASDANYTITLPSINLSGSDGATLSFYTQCDTEYDSINWNDYMVLEISNDGSAFTTGFAWDEYSIDDDLDDSNIAGYYFDELSLPNSYLQSAFTIRFRWVSDSDADTGTIGDGCFIDNIKINKYSGSASDVYDYMQGTSMAAPHVAGLAALIKGYNSGLSNAEIKSNILATGDSLAALSGKTVSGKRINAYNALAAADGTPPVITLTGDATVDITVGDAYTDAGATATDDVDGDISGSIVTVNPVNTAIADTYTVTYDVSDAAANEAVTVTRTVNVNAVPVPDTTPPVITLIGSAIVDINVGDVYLDEGATATDDV